MSLPALSPKIARFPAQCLIASLLLLLLYWQGIVSLIDSGHQFTNYSTLQAETASSLVAVVRHAPVINGRIEGTIQQLSAENVTINSGAVITADLKVPGTPTVQINGSANYGGTQTGGGTASPTGHRVTLNSGATLGHVVRRTDPVPLDPVPVPPPATGTRNVTVNAPGQSLGDFGTLRDLTLNSNAGLFTIPGGNYRRFTVNGQSGFVFGVAGSSEPSVYNLEELTLNSNSQLQVIGPVVINLANRVTVNGGAVLGGAFNADWVSLNVAR